MTGQRIGYKRVSTVDQNTARQLDGVQVDKMFEDHCSGKDIDRPQLALCLEFVRDGDTLVIHSMDRLARNLDDLRRVVRELTSKGVAVEFIKEHLTFTAQDNPMSNLLLSVMGAFAEFERSLINERQREGIAHAKRAKVYKGRRQAVTGDRLQELIARKSAGESVSALATAFKVSRETIYTYLESAKNRQSIGKAQPSEAEVSV